MGAHAPEYERLPDDLDDDDFDDCGCDLAGLFWQIWPGILGALTALVIMVPALYYPYLWSFDEGKFPEYRVAVAGFSGIDPDRDLARAALDPTFDLTVRLTEPRKYSADCVERGTTASVSYRRVALARGPVPEFCGRSQNTTEVGSVMAWGTAVPVPRFARDSLAEELRRGDAVVDVALTTPARICPGIPCYEKVVECRAALGRGEASPPCRVSHQSPTIPDQADMPRPVIRKLLRPGKSDGDVVVGKAQ